MNILKQSIFYKQYCGLIDFFLIQKNKYSPHFFLRIFTAFRRYSQKSSFVAWLLHEDQPLSYESGSLFLRMGDFLFSSSRNCILQVSKESIFISFLRKIEEKVTTNLLLTIFLLFFILFLVLIINLILIWIK